MTATSNKNLISDTQSNRLSVTPATEQLIKDTTSNALFVGDGSTAGGRAVDARPFKSLSNNYTLTREEEGKVLHMNSSTARTITIPPNSSVSFPTNLTRIPFINIGTAALTFTAGTGVTINPSSHSIGQYEGGELIKTDTNVCFTVTFYITYFR